MTAQKLDQTIVPKLTEEMLKNAVAYANFHDYSKAMSVVNLKQLQIPIPTPLKELKDPNKKLKDTDKNTFRIRSSHGILHVLGAMESVDDIITMYREQVKSFSPAITAISAHFKLHPNDLILLVKLAVLLHDSARQGDGMDLWDEESADACEIFLKEEWKIDAELAQFIADAIRFKDDTKTFQEKYKSVTPQRLPMVRKDKEGNVQTYFQVDFIRQLVNMGDTLEVIRTRDEFKPEFMPIANHVTDQVMINTVIPNLVEPHRQLIDDQGRLQKEAKIVFPGYTDKGIAKKHLESDDERMAKTYLEKSKKYDLSLLEINQDTLSDAVARTIRGIETYIEENKNPGIHFFHNGFFSPRYHGETGINRAKYYLGALKDLKSKPNTELEQTALIYALLSSYNGPTLQEAVMRSFNQVNDVKTKAELKTLMHSLNMVESHGMTGNKYDLNNLIENHVHFAEEGADSSKAPKPF